LQPKGKLPQCFVREYGDVIAPCVVLQDPNLNEIEVRIIKKCNKMYFGEGWSIIKNVYDVLFGAWVTFAYVNPNLLIMRLMTRWGVEVKYPLHSPPLKHLLARNSTYDGFTPVPSSDPLVPAVTNKCFVHSYVKKITYYDLHSGTLVISYSLFFVSFLIFKRMFNFSIFIFIF
jgi:hypothetical protein